MKRVVIPILLLSLGLGASFPAMSAGRPHQQGQAQKKQGKRGIPPPDSYIVPTSPSNPRVLVETSRGSFTIELFPDQAPGTVKNFLGYVDKGFYDLTMFHRVISKFVIQGGGYDLDGVEKTADPGIPSESANGLQNRRGSLALARMREPGSGAAQFFINVVDNRYLDKEAASDGVGYTVFGQVVEGMEVVDHIKTVKTTKKLPLFEALPTPPVVIKSIRRVE